MHGKETLTTLTLTALGSIIFPAFLGAFGGGTRYLSELVMDKKVFIGFDFFSHVIMGIFVGLTIHYGTFELFGVSYSGLILVGGLISKEAINFARKSGLSVLLKRVLNVEYKDK